MTENEVVSYMDERALLKRITVNPKIFAGKPIIRGRRLAVEHVLSMLAVGDTLETLLKAYPWWRWKTFRLVWSMPTLTGGNHEH